MDKTSFLTALRTALADMPQEDIDERVNFYSEMIDDYVEEGLSEDEAIGRIGSTKDIAAQIIADAPLSNRTAQKPVKRKRGWQIALIALGSPIWLSLLISAFAVILSVYICLWAVVISLWAVFVSICACGLAFTVGGIGMIFCGYWQAGLAMIGAGLILSGLGILFYYVCKAVTKGIAWLTKKSALRIKNRLSKRRVHNEYRN